MSTAIDVLLEVATSQLGVSEYPAGSNRTPYGEWFGMDGQPWCDIFASWCADQAGLDAVIPRSAYVPGRLAAARAAGRVYRTPARGDLGCMDWNRDGIPDHIVIVTRVLNAQYFETIEGNTSPSDAGNQSNGGMVCARTRRVIDAAGFIRPNYPLGAWAVQVELSQTGLNAVADTLLGALPPPAGARYKVQDGTQKLGITDALTHLLATVDGLAADVAKIKAQLAIKP